MLSVDVERVFALIVKVTTILKTTNAKMDVLLGIMKKNFLTNRIGELTTLGNSIHISTMKRLKKLDSKLETTTANMIISEELTLHTMVKIIAETVHST